MADIKTKITTASVAKFLRQIESENRRNDSVSLLKIFEAATGLKAKLWSTNIVGFGMYHYKSERSAQAGDWFLTGFAARKQNLTIYIMPGFKDYGDLLQKLGKYKTSVSCLYSKQLSDIDTQVLTEIIKRSVIEMRDKYC